MVMKTGDLGTDELMERAETLAAWVEMFREGDAVPEIRFRETDPLSRLGNELQLLASALERQERELERLFELVEDVEKGVLLTDVLDRVFEGFRSVIPYDRIGCAFLSEDGSKLSAHWARTELGPVQISSGYSQPMVGSSLERIIQTGQPRIINDLEAYLEAKPQSKATRSIVREGGRASLTCPLVVGKRPIGFLFFTSRQKNIYTGKHQNTFGRIAGQVSIVIERSRIYQKIVDRNKELIEHGRQLEECANRDALTGVLNRGAIMRLAEQAFTQAQTHGGSIGMIMSDLDYFKAINDRFGHASGDRALVETTGRISAQLDSRGYLGRYGGEEFLIVVPGAKPESLLAMAEQLRGAVAARPIDVGSQSIPITMSFGCAVSAGEIEKVQTLIAAADGALYRAKKNGRNRVALDKGTDSDDHQGEALLAAAG